MDVAKDSLVFANVKSFTGEHRRSDSSCDTCSTSSNNFESKIPTETIKPEDSGHSFAKFDELVEICQTSRKYFKSSDTKIGQTFYKHFECILNRIATARQLVTEFNGFVHEYDFDDKTPGSGYRSLLKAMHAAIQYCIKICGHITKNRRYLLFRKSVFIKEIEACNNLLDSLCCAFEEALKIRAQCEYGQLIFDGDHKAIDLFNMFAEIKQPSFYGRCVGFQYCEAFQPFAKMIGVAEATYSDMFFSKNKNQIIKMTSSLYSGSKYYRNPELRAKRIIDVSLYARVDFVQAFVSLSERELIYKVPSMMGSKVKINKLIKIMKPEPFEMENVHKPNEWVKIPIPSSHLGDGPITVRLISYVRREGMLSKRNKRRIRSMSNSLLIHCHGGGFIGQTSKSHEVYLREWAAQLQVPILSIDYSVAPQAPYPRALEEAFYAYCWAIKNARLLGSTAERIIVTGDSAGGFLTIELTLKCIEQSVRPPDGVFVIYCPFVAGFERTPSRILSSMDVLIPFGFLVGMLKAYISPGDDKYLPMPFQKKKKSSSKSQNSNEKSNKDRPNFTIGGNVVDKYLFEVPRDPFLSPLYASDEMLKQFPPLKMLTLENDPFVDDCVTMAKKLRTLGKPVGLDILPELFNEKSLSIVGLPHGFLHLIQVLKEANDANNLCMTRLAELLQTKDVYPREKYTVIAKEF